MKVWERIESLRKRMREEDIDVYYIQTNDFPAGALCARSDD